MVKYLTSFCRHRIKALLIHHDHIKLRIVAVEEFLAKLLAKKQPKSGTEEARVKLEGQLKVLQTQIKYAREWVLGVYNLGMIQVKG